MAECGDRKIKVCRPVVPKKDLYFARLKWCEGRPFGVACGVGWRLKIGVRLDLSCV